ncbi:MAG: glycosyltransferase family 4 protein [Nanoarchaeota archaeon]
MKILELCHYSAGVCGVWSRVREESSRLVKKGYKVTVFSSNHIKSSDAIAPNKDSLNGIEIKRFKAKKLGGESFMYWNFVKEAVDMQPDIIIAHNYRQIHTTKALKVARILRKKGKKVKVFLVTHAPFVEGNITRSFIAKIAVKLYDSLIGRATINKFDKVITISNWELPYLYNIGLEKNKVEYIPNGIPEQFFTQKAAKEKNIILFFARISPKKKVETLVEAIPYLKNKDIKIEIVGPREKDYFDKIKHLIKKLRVEKRIIISQPIYYLNKKIEKIDSCKVFVLPSRVEGMPQSLIEALARGKIVIGSDSIAIRDLIKDGKNGFLFEFDNPRDLARKIDISLKAKNQKIKKNAKIFVKQFSWDKIIDKIEKLIRQS